ncbi:MAG: hypothetical protein NXI31_00135 [bacterium]|nr:hypothetical protein [bacterium]
MNRIHLPLSLSLASLLCLAVAPTAMAQSPTPGVTPESSAERRLDVIELKNGERFEGRVLTELDGYVEFEIEAGSVVGIGRNRVKQIQRGAGRLIQPVLSAIEPSDEWFALHDAEGVAVGWLHVAVVVAAQGMVTITEEYEFVEGRRRYQITSQCRASANLDPLGCYFRERISEPILAIAPGEQDRVVGERIVDCKCAGDRLLVTHADQKGRREREYRWDAAATFPLLARLSARTTGRAIRDVMMFDPATEEFSVRSIAEQRRRAVELGGRTQNVTEIIESGADTSNSVWLDASMRTLRREIAGPALVALPSAARGVKAKVGRARIPAALAREAGGRFGLWVPNPAWRVAETTDPGSIALACDVHGASIGVTRIEHLAVGTPIATAAEAVTNWFRLLHPGMQVVARERHAVRDRIAIRLRAEDSHPRRAQKAIVDVIPHEDAFLVLLCVAPESAWRELLPDFDFVQRTIELAPEGVEPPLSGPLRRREQEAEREAGQRLRRRGGTPRGEARGTRSPARSKTLSPTPAGRSRSMPPKRELPTVRIPRQPPVRK